MDKKIDQLILVGEQCIFEKATGEKLEMPNLTALVNWYKEHKGTDIGERIKEILSLEIGDLLLVEVMVNMAHEKTLERLRDGEIKRNMGHVQTYQIILDSQVDQAKAQFAQEVVEGKLEGTFEDAFFAQFPYGMVIMRDKFPTFKNNHYSKADLETLLESN